MSVYFTAHDVAEWFLTKSSMSNKKIQKLVYYAYAWTLTLLNESADQLENKLFEEPIEAWVHGAVVRSLYAEFADYGWSDVPKINESASKICMDKSCEDVKDVLGQVWDAYGDYSANDLESINHKEAPWINARKGLAPYEVGANEIDDIDIFNYYNEQ